MEKLPSQGSGVGKKCVIINLWTASHEDKRQHVPKKTEEKIKVHKKRVRRGLHRPMLMDEGKGKNVGKCCVVKDIEQQRGK